MRNAAPPPASTRSCGRTPRLRLSPRRGRPGPATLIDPEPAAGGWHPGQPEPLPDWNRPVGYEPLVPPPAPEGQPAGAGSPVAHPEGSNGHRVLEGSSLGTAATSTTHHFQVSTPNTVVVPAPAPVPPPAPMPVAPMPAPGLPIVATPTSRRVPRGILRRAWLVALALVAGSAGGWFAGKHAGTSYAAQATVVVRSGSSRSGPGSANDALALATTYAALIPKDQSVLGVAGRTLGVSPNAVGHSLSVTVENGTSILLIDYSAASAGAAINGARAVAGAVASTTPVSLAIGPGSVAVVSEPTSAHLQGTLHKYGIVIGGLLGLLVGLVLLLAAERADPRVDDAAAMATASGCRAAVVPGSLSFPELGRVLADAGRGAGREPHGRADHHLGHRAHHGDGPRAAPLVAGRRTGRPGQPRLLLGGGRARPRDRADRARLAPRHPPARRRGGRAAPAHDRPGPGLGPAHGRSAPTRGARSCGLSRPRPQWSGRR